jgi:hypothetical protein
VSSAQGPPASHYPTGGVIMPPDSTQPPHGPAPGSPQQQTAELITFD